MGSMMSGRVVRTAEEQFGEAADEASSVLEALRRGLPLPADRVSLIEDAAALGIGAGHLVLDVGAGSGHWSRLLVDRFRCACIPVDAARARVREASRDGLSALLADAEMLPVASGSVDAIWCRDTLSTLEDPVVVLREFHRVLRAGGGVVLYTALTTELLESDERARLMKALSAPGWWALGRGPVDEAIAAAEFDVMRFEVKSPAYSESLLATDPGEVTAQLAELAQLRRGRDAIEAAIGHDWYERFVAWSQWQAYLLLGKLDTALWLLRKTH
jgi:SAM-dependent methyltransferase